MPPQTRCVACLASATRMQWPVGVCCVCACVCICVSECACVRASVRARVRVYLCVGARARLASMCLRVMCVRTRTTCASLRRLRIRLQVVSSTESVDDTVTGMLSTLMWWCGVTGKVAPYLTLVRLLLLCGSRSPTMPDGLAAAARDHVALLSTAMVRTFAPRHRAPWCQHALALPRCCRVACRVPVSTCSDCVLLF